MQLCSEEPSRVIMKLINRIDTTDAASEPNTCLDMAPSQSVEIEKLQIFFTMNK